MGAAGWRALRWRWAWPVARAGGAVARRPPSSLAARAAPGARESRSQERATRSRGWSGGREEPCDHRDPRPERLARWVGAWRGCGAGDLLSVICLRPKIVGYGRVPGLMASLPVSAHPPVFSPLISGWTNVSFRPGTGQDFGTPLLRSLDYWALESQPTKLRTGSVCLPVTWPNYSFNPVMFSWLYCQTDLGLVLRMQG